MMDVMKKKTTYCRKRRVRDVVLTSSTDVVCHFYPSITVVFSLFTFVIPTVASAMSKFPTPSAARLSEVTTTFSTMITFLAHPAIHS